MLRCSCCVLFCVFSLFSVYVVGLLFCVCRVECVLVCCGVSVCFVCELLCCALVLCVVFVWDLFVCLSCCVCVCVCFVVCMLCMCMCMCGVVWRVVFGDGVLCVIMWLCWM